MNIIPPQLLPLQIKYCIALIQIASFLTSANYDVRLHNVSTPIQLILVSCCEEL